MISDASTCALDGVGVEIGEMRIVGADVDDGAAASFVVAAVLAVEGAALCAADESFSCSRNSSILLSTAGGNT